MNRICPLVVLTALFLVSACAHQANKTGEPKEAATPTYPERIQDRLEKMESQEVHLVRYNPTPCGCPPHEIQLDGQWQRVQLDVERADDPALLALQAAEEEARSRGELKHHSVQGQLNSDLSTCGRGAIMVHLSPSAFGAPEEAEIVEQADDLEALKETPEEN